jgi:hypothetical protein
MMLEKQKARKNLCILDLPQDSPKCFAAQSEKSVVVVSIAAIKVTDTGWFPSFVTVVAIKYQMSGLTQKKENLRNLHVDCGCSVMPHMTIVTTRATPKYAAISVQLDRRNSGIPEKAASSPVMKMETTAKSAMQAETHNLACHVT